MHDSNEPSWDDVEITPLEGDGSDDIILGDEQAPTTPQEDNPDDIRLDDNNERIAQDVKPDDNDDIIINVPEGTEGKNADTTNDNDENENDDNKNDTSDLTGIEQYLASFDIEGGMISFEGEEKMTHFNDLSASDQKQVLDDLHEEQTGEIEDKYGLEDDEVNLISYCRDNKMSVSQLVENMANERVETLMALQTGAEADYVKMDDDAVFMQFLQRTQGEASSDITKMEAALAEAKGTSTYKATVDTLRGQFKNEQSQQKYQADSDAQKVMMDEIEDQRTAVVQAAKGINDIAGIEINDTVKNSILDKVLDINEDFDSKFVEEALGGPEQAFKTAFWFYYGEDILTQRDEYWKKEKSAAYKRGMQDALGNNNSNKQITFADEVVTQPTNNQRSSNRTTPNQPHRKNSFATTESWDDMY